MNEINRIIAFTCLKFHDSGEASTDREARLIIQALEKNGYSIIKNDMPYSITIEELLERPLIRDDKHVEYMNKMTDGEIKEFMDEVKKAIERDGETKRIFPDWQAAILARLIDRDILYELFKKGGKIDGKEAKLKEDRDRALKEYRDFWDRHSRTPTEGEREEENFEFPYTPYESDLDDIKIRLPLSETEQEELRVVMSRLNNAYRAHAMECNKKKD